MVLSIIIPYHETYDLTIRLLDVLVPQLTSEVEVILINDCDSESFEGYPIKVLFIEGNGTASKPRNLGLDVATGQYIAFIDSDDLVSDDYIAKILDKIQHSNFDYCFYSWQFLNSGDVILISNYPPSWNCSVINCIYKRSLIGEHRFDEALRVAEDYKFNSEVRRGTKENILDVLYYYNDGREGSIMNTLNVD